MGKSAEPPAEAAPTNGIISGRDGGRLTPARASGQVVAIVGAGSFLGANLLGLLEEDPRVRRIVAIDGELHDRQERHERQDLTGMRGAKTRAYPLDLTEPKADARLSEILTAERVDTLVHVAFLAAPSHATAWAHELESVGTMHTMVAARHAQVRKVVLWSQTILYGAHPTNPNFLTEKHPLRANRREPFFADKVEAEAEVLRFADRSPGSVVTILRVAPILGPTVENYLTRYLSHRLVPTMMGFDPLFQLVHEIDAIAAFKLAIERDVPGIFNIVADGVLPLSTVIKLAGRVGTPIPHPLAESATAALWMAQVADAPPSFLKYLRFLCVADGQKAWTTMGFRPAYTTREALLDFASAQRLRDVHLLNEQPREARQEKAP